MNFQLERLEKGVSGWPNISVRPHRFAAREFRFGKAEVGHVHTGGIVDIPFPRPIRDALLDGGLAKEHHWVPNYGWITFGVRTEQDLQHALWLLRLSYIRYALKTDHDPRRLFEQESECLQLSPRFASLLAEFLPRIAAAMRVHGCTNLTTETVKGTAHYVAEEKPEVVAELIRRYATRTGSATRSNDANPLQSATSTLELSAYRGVVR